MSLSLLPGVWNLLYGGVSGARDVIPDGFYNFLLFTGGCISTTIDSSGSLMVKVSARPDFFFLVDEDKVISFPCYYNGLLMD